MNSIVTSFIRYIGILVNPVNTLKKSFRSICAIAVIGPTNYQKLISIKKKKPQSIFVTFPTIQSLNQW